MVVKKAQVGVVSLIVFATMVIVGAIVLTSIQSSTASLASTTAATAAVGNTTNNSFSALNLVAVGPIIFGAVIILGIVGLLYMRGQ